jgi:phosphomannomutase
MNLIFDVDGTLTPAREPIDKYFRVELELLSKIDNIYLATGSDYSKTVEQLGLNFVENSVAYSFNCSGNSIWRKGKEVYRNEWTLYPEIEEWLGKKLKESKFSIRTGTHIEARPGMVNFTILGRNATIAERAAYMQFDLLHNERVKIATELNELFSETYEVTAQVAGATGFDIYPKGRDKSQILNWFKDIPVVFFGDDIRPGGNDYSLSQAIKARGLEGDAVYPIQSPSDTRYKLSLI